MTTAEKLQAHLKKRGWSVSEFARQLDKPKSNVSEWVNGKTEPNLESVRQIRELFDCSLNAIVGDEAA